MKLFFLFVFSNVDINLYDIVDIIIIDGFLFDVLIVKFGRLVIEV